MSNPTVGPVIQLRPLSAGPSTQGPSTGVGPGATSSHSVGPGLTGIIIHTVEVDNLYFEFTQSVPAGDWYVVHNLGKYPNVEVINSDGDAILADVHFISLNAVHITFPDVATGKVICS